MPPRSGWASTWNRVRKVEKCIDRFRMKCEIRYVEVPQTFQVEECVNGGRLCFNTSNTVSNKLELCCMNFASWLNQCSQVVREVPEEDCTLTPQKGCYMGFELLPTLQSSETCVSVPDEICSLVRTNPKTVRTPIIRKTCVEEDQVEGNIYKSRQKVWSPGWKNVVGKARKAWWTTTGT